VVRPHGRAARAALEERVLEAREVAARPEDRIVGEKISAKPSPST